MDNSDNNGKRLTEIGDRMFANRAPLLNLWQAIAEQVYPERADFTVQRIDGDEFAAHLFESTPVQHRRDFASAWLAATIPRGKTWFRPRALDKHRNTHNSKLWLDDKGEVMRSRIYAGRANFSPVMMLRANDYVTFGNAVTSRVENANRDGSVFESWHLRDCVWADDEYGEASEVHRKVKITVKNKAKRFGMDSLSPSEVRALEKEPHKEVEIRHVAMRSEGYDAMNKRIVKGKDYASIYYDPAQHKVLKEGGYFEFPYHVSRWMRQPNSPYAYSPAASAGLIDARLIQAQAEVILEAGEKAVEPAYIATRDAVLGGVNTYSGGVTWVDNEYDERLGASFKALEHRGNLGIGLEMKQDARAVHSSAWFLNKLFLPLDREMTAYEARERVAEYIRSATPIFEPVEVDNSRMLDGVWDSEIRITAAMNKSGRPGPFGWLEEIPDELEGQEIHYEMDTPLAEAYELMKSEKGKQATAYIAEQVQLTKDESLWDHVNKDKIVRDGAMGIAGEADWFYSEDEVKQGREQRQQEQAEQAQQMQQDEELARKSQQLEMVPKAQRANKSMKDMMEGAASEEERAAITQMFGEMEGAPAQ
jgi:hypothetical protein